MKKKCIKIAYTLSEILVMVIVIGIIASIIFTIIKNTNYKEKTVKLKAEKVMADITSATEEILTLNSNDGTMKSLVGVDGSLIDIRIVGTPTRLGLANLYKSKLEVIKSKSPTRAECSEPSLWSTEAEFQAINPFLLKNGTCMYITNFDPGTISSCIPGESSPYTSTANAQLFIDVNGPEEPNQQCIDIYTIPIGTSGILWNSES